MLALVGVHSFPSAHLWSISLPWGLADARYSADCHQVSHHIPTVLPYLLVTFIICSSVMDSALFPHNFNSCTFIVSLMPSGISTPTLCRDWIILAQVSKCPSLLKIVLIYIFFLVGGGMISLQYQNYTFQFQCTTVGIENQMREACSGSGDSGCFLEDEERETEGAPWGIPGFSPWVAINCNGQMFRRGSLGWGWGLIWDILEKWHSLTMSSRHSAGDRMVLRGALRTERTWKSGWIKWKGPGRGRGRQGGLWQQAALGGGEKDVKKCRADWRLHKDWVQGFFGIHKNVLKLTGDGCTTLWMA